MLVYNLVGYRWNRELTHNTGALAIWYHHSEDRWPCFRRAEFVGRRFVVIICSSIGTTQEDLVTIAVSRYFTGVLAACRRKRFRWASANRPTNGDETQIRCGRWTQSFPFSEIEGAPPRGDKNLDSSHLTSTKTFFAALSFFRARSQLPLLAVENHNEGPQSFFCGSFTCASTLQHVARLLCSGPPPFASRRPYDYSIALADDALSERPPIQEQQGNQN